MWSENWASQQDTCFYRRARPESQKDDFESCLCCDGEPVHFSWNRGDVIAHPRTGNHPCERVEDSLQLPEIFRRMFHGERSYGIRDGSQPSKLATTQVVSLSIHRSRSTYITQGSAVEISRLTHIIHVIVEEELVVESDAKALYCLIASNLLLHIRNIAKNCH